MMNDDSDNNADAADIVALVERYLDGELTADEQTLLFARLRSDERAQTLFVRTLMQAAYLHELLSQQRSAVADRCGVVGGSVGDAAPALPAPVESPAGPDGASAAFGLSQIQGWLTGWRGMGLVATVLLVLAGVLLWGRGDSGKVAERAARASQEAFDARSIEIRAGSARVTLPKVGYMLVDGPADVELIAPLRAKLKRGRIRVRVTEKTGRGFVVETPDGQVVDLSTEFGLEVAEGQDTGLVVFDGAVDLHLGKSAAGSVGRVERLISGEGVTFNKRGAMDRLVSITTGKVATFLSDDKADVRRHSAVIVKVRDNLRSEDTKKFYEIVPGGMGEDALAYVDRPAHEWNGMTKAGMPKFLLGADYVKTFSDDKARDDMAIDVWLSRPAKLYVFFDSRLRAPKWLESDYRKVKEIVGMDLGPWPTIGYRVRRGVGPGVEVDHRFTIWERVVKEPGVVRLGGNGTYDVVTRQRSIVPYMYSIAAVALEREKAERGEGRRVKDEGRRMKDEG